MNTDYKVVVNSEEQYSVWPEDRPNPTGFRDANQRGSRQQCVDYILRRKPGVRPEELDALEDRLRRQ